MKSSNDVIQFYCEAVNGRPSTTRICHTSVGYIHLGFVNVERRSNSVSLCVKVNYRITEPNSQHPAVAAIAVIAAHNAMPEQKMTPSGLSCVNSMSGMMACHPFAPRHDPVHRPPLCGRYILP